MHQSRSEHPKGSTPGVLAVSTKSAKFDGGSRLQGARGPNWSTGDAGIDPWPCSFIHPIVPWAWKYRLRDAVMHDLFMVIRRYGGPYDPTTSLEKQVDWVAHRAFMNALEASGFARLAGPLEGGEDVLLIVRAESSDAIERQLAVDPWTQSGISRQSGSALGPPTRPGRLANDGWCSRARLQEARSGRDRSPDRSLMLCAGP